MPINYSYGKRCIYIYVYVSEHYFKVMNRENDNIIKDISASMYVYIYICTYIHMHASACMCVNVDFPNDGLGMVQGAKITGRKLWGLGAHASVKRHSDF